jgi:hypothetical protein
MGEGWPRKMPITDQHNKTKTAGARLGFIGLGYMGSRIAKRLIDAGHRVVVYNRDRAKVEALISQGAELTASAGELASAADIILSCLSDESAVRNLYFREGGVLDHAKPGSVILEMSTIAPGASIQLAEAGRACGNWFWMSLFPGALQRRKPEHLRFLVAVILRRSTP